jgi:hypothetical protein
MTIATRRLPIAALGVALALLLAACGSSAGSPTAPQPSPLAPAQKAQDKVLAMVLNTGDIPGFTLQSDGGENLKDQLPKKGTPHYVVARRLVMANWLASEHSIVIRTADGKAAIVSDANLFKSTETAARIWKLENYADPGIRIRRLPPPGGAPLGARYAYETNGKRAGFELLWRRGSVIAYVFVGAHPGEKFSRIALSRIAAFISTAARAQDHRIASVQAGVLAY